MTDVSEVLTTAIIVPIILMIDAVSTSEMSVNYETTRHDIPKDLSPNCNRV
jgi:hypothetical protein